MRVKRTAALAVMALIAGLISVPTTASANHDPVLNITQGAALPGTPGFSHRFMSPTLQVHRGTTLVFSPTALLLPVDTDAARWSAQNAETVGAPYTFIQPDSDDGLGALKYNNAVLFPSSFTCGTTTAPCTYDGDVFNGGGLSESFAVVIDVAPGSFFYAQNPFNASHRLRVEVVTNADAATTQADIDAFRTSRTAIDTETAQALHNKMLNKNSTHTAADGTLVRDVFVGMETQFFSLFAMYPRATTIKKGQRVRYHFSQNQHELHTATMPRSTALEIAGSNFAPQCDPDGDSGPGPDTDPTFDPASPLPSCPAGSVLEFEVAPQLVGPIGDGRYTGGSDVEHSGTRSPRLASPPTAGDAPYTVTFTKPTGTTPVKVDCAIHPGMINRVTVRR